MGIFGSWIDVGVFGGGWTRESWGGQVRVGWIDELVYLVSVGVECVCVKGSLVLVLVLGWTQCVPQRVGAPLAMLRGRTAGFPKKLDGRASGEAGKVDTICTVFPPTVPPTVAHQPRAGCIRLVRAVCIFLKLESLALVLQTGAA